jgi:hypothetical protein
MASLYDGPLGDIARRIDERLVEEIVVMLHKEGQSFTEYCQPQVWDGTQEILVMRPGETLDA